MDNEPYYYIEEDFETEYESQNDHSDTYPVYYIRGKYGEYEGKYHIASSANKKLNELNNLYMRSLHK